MCAHTIPGKMKKTALWQQRRQQTTTLWWHAVRYLNLFELGVHGWSDYVLPKFCAHRSTILWEHLCLMSVFGRSLTKICLIRNNSASHVSFVLKFGIGAPRDPVDGLVLTIYFRSNPRWPTAGQSTKVPSVFDLPLALPQLSFGNGTRYVKYITMSYVIPKFGLVRSTLLWVSIWVCIEKPQKPVEKPTAHFC